jgi:hypothetical protein
MYVLSKKHNFKLLVDFSLHDMKNYIEPIEHDYGDIIIASKDNIPVYIQEPNIMSYINNNDNEVILMFGWSGLKIYDVPLTEDAQIFMKNILRPNIIMQYYIDTQLLEIPFDQFNIIHYRLGDDDMIKSITQDYTLDHIISNLEKNDVLISDSSTFKNLVKTANIEVFMFNSNICHTGHNNTDNSIQDTLFELYLITKASRVKAYSVYGWTSGFVKAISYIYKVPIKSETNISVWNKRPHNPETIRKSETIRTTVLIRKISSVRAAPRFKMGLL